MRANCEIAAVAPDPVKMTASMKRYDVRYVRTERHRERDVDENAPESDALMVFLIICLASWTNCMVCRPAALLDECVLLYVGSTWLCMYDSMCFRLWPDAVLSA